MKKIIIVGTVESKDNCLKQKKLFDLRTKKDLIEFDKNEHEYGFFHGLAISSAERILNIKNGDIYTIVLSENIQNMQQRNHMGKDIKIEKEDKLFNDLHKHILSILGNEEITSDWFKDKFIELDNLTNNVKWVGNFIEDKNDFIKKSRHIHRITFLAYLSLLLKNKEIILPHRLYENAYNMANYEIAYSKFAKLLNFEILNNIPLETFTPFETKFDFDTLDGKEFIKIFNSLSDENKIKYLQFRKEESKKNNLIYHEVNWEYAIKWKAR